MQGLPLRRNRKSPAGSRYGAQAPPLPRQHTLHEELDSETERSRVTRRGFGRGIGLKRAGTVAGAGLQVQDDPAEGNALPVQTLAVVQTRRAVGRLLWGRTLAAVSCPHEHVARQRAAPLAVRDRTSDPPVQ